MRLSRTVMYSIRLLFNLAKSGNTVMAEDMARESDIPRPYASKILQRLAKYGYLESYKGRGGGFKLHPKSLELTLMEVIYLLEGDMKLDQCLFEFSDCTKENPCAFCKEWNDLSDQISNLFLQFKIKDFLYEFRKSETFNLNTVEKFAGEINVSNVA
jgi:Rrf2 family protein